MLHHGVIALLAASAIMSAMVLYAANFGLRVLLRWDLASGSELQLALERRTYLVSTVLAYVFGFQLLSLFLFIFTAEDLHPLFVGAMCAAGTLNVNGWGYPALGLKVAVFILAGLWLVMNHADNRAHDYPLIKKKYALLLLIAPLFLLETVMQAMYLLTLRADVITSCCGTLFSVRPAGAESAGVGGASFLSTLSALPLPAMFYGVFFLVFLAGAWVYRTGRGGHAFSLLSLAAFLISVLSLIVFVTPYFYELPTHRCPFCILQKAYGYVGYPLYLSLLGGTVAGAGAGLLSAFRGVESLEDVAPPLQRRLILASLLMFFVFLAIVIHGIAASGLRVE